MQLLVGGAAGGDAVRRPDRRGRPRARRARTALDRLRAGLRGQRPLLPVRHRQGRRLPGGASRRHRDPGGAPLGAEPERRQRGYRVLARISHPAVNHNGGQLAFGPDGALYAAIGDGGSQGDPEGDAQNPASPLGKILRFADPAGSAAPTVWASGLRNPWRFSFDRADGRRADRRRRLERARGGRPAAVRATRRRRQLRLEPLRGRRGRLRLDRGDGAAARAPPRGWVRRDHRRRRRARSRRAVARGPLRLRRPGEVDRVLRRPGDRRAARGAVAAVSGPRSWGEDACGRVYLATRRRGAPARRGGDDGAPARRPPPPPPPPPTAGAAAAAARGGGHDGPGGAAARPAARIGRFAVRLRADEAAVARVRARGYRPRERRAGRGSGAPRTRARARRSLRRLRGTQRIVRAVRVARRGARRDATSRCGSAAPAAVRPTGPLNERRAVGLVAHRPSANPSARLIREGGFAAPSDNALQTRDNVSTGGADLPSDKRPATAFGPVTTGCRPKAPASPCVSGALRYGFSSSTWSRGRRTRR